jgi:hypothetical protein
VDTSVWKEEEVVRDEAFQLLEKFVALYTAEM